MRHRWKPIYEHAGVERCTRTTCSVQRRPAGERWQYRLKNTDRGWFYGKTPPCSKEAKAPSASDMTMPDMLIDRIPESHLVTIDTLIAAAKHKLDVQLAGVNQPAIKACRLEVRALQSAKLAMQEHNENESEVYDVEVPEDEIGENTRGGHDEEEEQYKDAVQENLLK